MQKFKFSKICLLIALIFFSVLLYLKVNLSHITVAYINNAPISLAEFKLSLSTHVAEAIGYFENTYDITYTPSFWDTPYGDELPIDWLRTHTLQDLGKIKIEQLLGVELGLIPTTNHSYFMSQLKEENTKRQLALQEDEIIYGPTFFEENDYLKYIHTNLIIQLKSQLSTSILNIDSNQVLNLYNERVSQGYYLRDNTIQTSALQLNKTYFGIDTNARNTALEYIACTKQYITNSADFDILFSNAEELSVLTSTPIYFNDETLFYDLEEQPELREIAYTLAPGEISDIITTYDKYTILRCDNIIENGITEFKNLESSLREEILNAMYSTYIDGLLDSSHIKINQLVFRHIYPE